MKRLIRNRPFWVDILRFDGNAAFTKKAMVRKSLSKIDFTLANFQCKKREVLLYKASLFKNRFFITVFMQIMKNRFSWSACQQFHLNSSSLCVVSPGAIVVLGKTEKTVDVASTQLTVTPTSNQKRGSAISRSRSHSLI